MNGAVRPAAALRVLGWLALLIAAVALIAWQLQHPSPPKVDADDQLGAPLVAPALRRLGRRRGPAPGRAGAL